MMKKAISICLSLLLMFSLTLPCFAMSADEAEALIPQLKEVFADGEGPEVGGISVDYVAFTPKLEDGVKYPVVVYFHGLGQGGEKRAQIASNNFVLWASDELQSRFTAGGAYLIAMRSHEENGEHWPNSYLPAVKAAVDDFIAKNADTVDISKIYVGGFSMGGSMTLRMMESYPDYFAAAFPMCPAYEPSADEVKLFANLPTWLIVSKYDVLAGYYTYSESLWNNLCKYSAVPGDCRLSLHGTVKLPNGKKAQSNHHVWFAMSNDLFMYDGSAYKNMETVDALGNTVSLEYPDGLIAWLNGYSSGYDGSETTVNELPENKGINTSNMIAGFFKVIFAFIASLFKF